jgi:periplasmic protein TonB
MLGTLLESNAPRQRRRAGTVASIVVHTAVIAAAIVATASARPGRPPADIPRENPPYVIPMPDAAAGQRATAPTPSGPRRRRDWVEGMVPIDRRTILYSPNPVPVPLADVDPRELLGADTIGLGLPTGPIGGGVLGRIVSDQPATLATVDRVAAMVAPPRPRYPDRLRAAGVTGRVVVRLVVDTLGRVEPASVVVRESSHELFAQAVRAVLASLRFSPAEVGGRKVRMLVDLPFEFRLHDEVGRN